MTASRQLLAAAMIVRDEARHIEACLDSLRPVCDEVVIVDTGSVDDTVALAIAAGARVVHRPWDGDFAAARNHGLDQIDAAWVLYIDADERLSVAEPAALRSHLSSDRHHVGFRLLFHPTVGSTPYRELRLWRHRPDIRFTGQMHEGIVVAVHDAGDRDGLAVGEVHVTIQHLGYEGDLTHKHRRNLPLLEAQLQADPERVYLWEELGRTHNGLGDRAQALAAWREGVRLVRVNGLRTPNEANVYGHLAAVLLDGTPEERDEAAALVAEIDRLEPAYRYGWWLQARIARDRERWLDAVVVLERLVAVDPALPGEDGIGYDARLFGEWAWHDLGVCLLQLGRHAEAADAFDAAAARSGDALEHRVKAIAARTLARRDAPVADLPTGAADRPGAGGS